MTILGKFSTRTKLAIAFGVMLLLLLGIAWFAYRAIDNINSAHQELFQRDFNNSIDLITIEADENSVRVGMLIMATSTNKVDQDRALADVRQNADAIAKTLQKLLNRNKNEGALYSRIEELNRIREAYAQTRETEIIPAIQRGDLQRAQTISLSIQQERFEKMRSIVRSLGDEARARAASAVSESNRKVYHTTRIFIAVGIGGALLGFLIVWFLTKAIANPLTELSRIAARIATGDLDVDLRDTDRTDEVGVLKQNFARMGKWLGGMADVARRIAAGDLRVKVTPQSETDVLGNAFATMVQNLRRTTAELSEGVNVLASSASEISASTSQVAATAAQTATAINETTTTVEEVKQTAQIASEKARHVSDSAQRANTIAASGRKSAEASIDAMTRIQTQMQSIAESIMRLTEQSQAIGEIIAVVSDLAEQSNLLAVNAAIEAAKAGEHGRGFGVVAQEIKTLAEQSKQATAQIRTILNDIQKATSAAVMTTEQGSKAVEAGSHQTTEAGESIRQLADSINEAAHSATQIAASSQQQLAGMDQVAIAMDSIRQASEQNVTGTKQTESAARNLQNLGVRLKQLLEQYQT